MTWKEIKDAALQLMFAYSNYGEIDTSDANKDYLLAMPDAANYALMDLSSSCRPILKRYIVTQHAAINLLSTTHGIVYSGAKVQEFMVKGAGSFTFRVSGNVDIAIEGAGVPIFRATNTTANYSLYTGLTGTEDAITIVFNPTGVYTIADLAFYAEAFDNVPPLSPYSTYDLKTLASGFRQLSVEHPVQYDSRDIAYLCKIDGTRVLVPSALHGDIEFSYYAYPTVITADTADDYVPELDAEALQIVPLYIASRLYADDDITQATLYQNMYDAQKRVLSSLNISLNGDEWLSESGWA